MEALKAEGAKHIFGIPGGANLPIYDAVHDAELDHIQARHEQGAGHMAEGYAKASGRVGVAFATSGPGATNLVTPIADAMLDSVPTVFITGQVRTDLIGTDGFQEADVNGITMPIVKHSFMVQDPRYIPDYVHAAFHIASTGRPGPVLVDVPQDLSRADIEYEPSTETPNLPGYKPSTEGNIKQIRIAAKALANAQRPVIYAGGGVINANASEELRELCLADNFPVTCTLMGLGGFPAGHEQWLGMLGMHGTRTANYAMDNADLIVNVGARFDDRITGKLSEFAPRAKFVHIDIDPAEISKNVPAHIPIVGDAKEVLPKLTKEYRAIQADRSRLDAWWERIHGWQKEYPLAYEDSSDGEIKPQRMIEAMFAATEGDAIITSDVGQHQMWAAQYYGFDKPRRWINSGGLGTMGFGLPSGDRRQRRPARRHGRLPRRRRQPDHDLPGARHRRAPRGAGQGLPDEQRLLRDGPPVAGALLGRPLLIRRDGPEPGLAEARRGLRSQRDDGRRQERGRGRHARSAGHRGPRPARCPRHQGRELLPDDPCRRRREGHGGLGMEAGTPDLINLADLDAAAGRLTGRKHVLSIMVENRPGVLARIAGLFSRRGFNIDTLAVGPTDDPEVSRITLTVDGAVHPIDQVTKQLHKLVNVIKIRDMEPGETIAREMALFKVSAPIEGRAEIMQFAEIFRAKIVDVSRRSLTIEVTGSSDKVEAFERMIRPHGLIEMVRTGEVAIARSKPDS